MIAEQLGMDKMAVHKIIKRIEEDPYFYENNIIRDESWFCQYDPEAKHQSNEWHTPQSSRQKKARMSKSRMKAMLIVFFDKKGVVYSEFVPEGQTVNGTFYVEVLKRLNPGLAPADFFPFPKVKTTLKGRHHGTLDDVKRVCTHALMDVSVVDFPGAYEAWKRHLQKCVHAQGAYFEDY
ncbi:histone-lysine n-methyltransferase setmar-like protein [Trichonephila clavipes]|nr:histone-lysine n-methyltransferase setmar-like protein [Trichonephila clavipes]